MKTLEIFSGAGGLAKGLELSGFEHAAFIEFNKHACESLRGNFDPKRVFFGDIKDFDLDSLESIDVVAGGPPCQPFSLGGKHKANQDSRDMFPYAIRTIERLSPKAFVFENVKGLLRQTFSEYFEYIILRLSYPDFVSQENADWSEHLDELRRLNKSSYTGKKYDVQYKLINAADYGVPQTRERVVIVGIRSDLALSWSFPVTTHSEDRLLWDMYVTGKYWERHHVPSSLQPILTAGLKAKVVRLKEKYGLFEPELMPWKTVRDALSDTPDPMSDHGIIDHVFRDGARIYPGHTGSDFDWPSKTIKAGGHGVPGGENMIRFHDGSVRYFTAFEAKRIQTFPDNFVIKGAWGEAMRQIGNAVPVLLAEKIGAALARQIGDH
ncbi:DNA cytosine methyltransferase [uncultured Deefgea sp.]|uniref:DNA cytosine methyltransferase n=1 Tax=uncultured Deefgea sp. TaxID=1304914 RepID=UPI00262FB3DF|nr:DNA cytosine methyltransferase [uncultured Deefgea sp.]